jgi:hypothetical protein
LLFSRVYCVCFSESDGCFVCYVSPRLRTRPRQVLLYFYNDNMRFFLSSFFFFSSIIYSSQDISNPRPWHPALPPEGRHRLGMYDEMLLLLSYHAKSAHARQLIMCDQNGIQPGTTVTTYFPRCQNDLTTRTGTLAACNGYLGNSTVP